MKVLYSIGNLPELIVGLSVSQKACGSDVFLNCHVWLLDHQFHGNNAV